MAKVILRKNSGEEVIVKDNVPDSIGPDNVIVYWTVEEDGSECPPCYSAEPGLTDRIRRFADDQFDLCEGDSYGMVSVADYRTGMEIINPWMDSTGRFPYTTEDAVAEYGKELIDRFCAKAAPYVKGYTVLYTDSTGVLSRHMDCYETKQEAEEAIAEGVRKVKAAFRPAGCVDVDAQNVIGTKTTCVVSDDGKKARWIRMWKKED